MHSLSTPVRIFVWLLFLGTAYQLIIQRLLEEWRVMRLQADLQDHVILCGYGHSGSIAAAELWRGWKSEQIVVVEGDRAPSAALRARIRRPAWQCVSEELLRMAGVERAHSLIVMSAAMIRLY
jgi:voltage-gated potassium channel